MTNWESWKRLEFRQTITLSTQTRICPRKIRHIKLSVIDPPVHAWSLDDILINKEDRTCYVLGFAMDQNFKEKEDESWTVTEGWGIMKDEYDCDINLSWINPKKPDQRLLKLKIRGMPETVQTKALCSSAGIHSRVMETLGDLLSHIFQRKPLINNWVAIS